jgi:hypothetical protein
VKSRMKEIFREYGGDLFAELSDSVIQNTIWKPFSRVAHFWASSILLDFENKANARDTAFPSTLSDLEHFLAPRQGRPFLAITSLVGDSALYT